MVKPLSIPNGPTRPFLDSIWNRLINIPSERAQDIAEDIDAHVEWLDEQQEPPASAPVPKPPSPPSPLVDTEEQEVPAASRLPQSSTTNETWSTGSRRDSRLGKGRYDLLSPIALQRIAKRLEDGAEHYGERNWEKGQPLTRYIDSALRHIYGHLEGKRDEDHMAAAAWNLHAFMHTEEMVRRRGLPESLMDGMPDYSPVCVPGCEAEGEVCCCDS